MSEFKPYVDENLNLTAEEVKAKMDAKDPALPVSNLFGLYFPIFKNGIERLSVRSLKRIIVAMVAQPLEDANLNLKLPIERELFAIFEKLFIARTFLITKTLFDSPEFQKALDNFEEKVNEEEQTKLEIENNGKENS